MRGEFTLRGISRPLTLRAQRFACGTHPVVQRRWCGGDFEAELLRSDYGLTFGLPLVADRVRLLVQVEAIQDALISAWPPRRRRKRAPRGRSPPAPCPA